MAEIPAGDGNAPLRQHMGNARIATFTARKDPELNVTDERLIVALDLPEISGARELAARLGDSVSFYKIGLGLLAGGYLALAEELKKTQGKRVFLDLKLFDIAATIEATVRALTRVGADFLTVHGDPHVVRAAREGAGSSELKIIGVMVLTSLDRKDLDASMIVNGPASGIVVERAARAYEAGADGVICSPLEAAAVRALPESHGRLIVTPGVRPSGSDPGDQKRTATPSGAIAAGADHIVVGRPIWKSADPKTAAAAILAELAGA